MKNNYGIIFNNENNIQQMGQPLPRVAVDDSFKSNVFYLLVTANKDKHFQPQSNSSLVIKMAALQRCPTFIITRIRHYRSRIKL